MSDTQTIKKATSYDTFFEQTKPKWAWAFMNTETALLGAPLMLAVACGLILAGMDVETSGLVGLTVAMVGAMGWVWWALSKQSKFSKQMKKVWETYTQEYHKYLSTYPLEFLVRVAKSPEIDHETKSQVTDYLNQHHSGWSLRQKSLKTTTKNSVVLIVEPENHKSL